MKLREAAKKAQVPYPTAARWLQQGLVKADGGGRPGSPYEIGGKQIRELKVLDCLRQAMPFQKLKKAAERLETLGNPYDMGRFAVLEHGSLRCIADASEATDLIQEDKGQILLVPIGRDPMDA